MNDIDLSSYSNWDPIGEVDVDTGTGQGFTGVLDGNGYTISNLTVTPVGESLCGLFGVIDNAEVKNLNIENFSAIASGQNNFAGGAPIAAYCLNSVINNCNTSGIMDSEYATMGAGISLMVEGSTISNCSSDMIINNTYNYCGGIVGAASGVTNIENCVYTGSMNGLTGCAIVFDGTANINNCYSNATLTAVITCGIALSAQSVNSSYSNSKLIPQAYTIMGSYTDNVSVYGLLGNGNLINSIFNTEKAGTTEAGDGSYVTLTNVKGLTTAEMQDPSNWSGWDTSVWDFSTYPPTFKMYTPTGGGSTGGGTGGTDPSDPSNPNTPGGGTGGAGDEPIPGAVRLQIGSDSSSTSAIYVDTSFDLGAFDVDFSSADSCAAAIEDIDEVLSRINTKRSEFGAVINRLSSILESQTTTIQNFTSAKSTIMDADIANESADFVKNQILQQTSSALLAQSQNLHASIVLSLIG